MKSRDQRLREILPLILERTRAREITWTRPATPTGVSEGVLEGRDETAESLYLVGLDPDEGGVSITSYPLGDEDPLPTFDAMLLADYLSVDDRQHLMDIIEAAKAQVEEA